MAYKGIEDEARKATKFFHVSRLCQDYRDHTPDPWLRLVIRRALEIVCKNKIFKDWDLKIEKGFDGQELNTAIKYDMKQENKGIDAYCCRNLFPLTKTTLICDNNGEEKKYEIQGDQNPDYVVIIEAYNQTSETKKRIAMVFEGEAHAKDDKKKNNGMFLYQKMFQDAAFCQDINPDVSAIFIALAMRACSKKETPEKWIQSLLESCVLMVTRLLTYTLNVLPGTDFISDELQKIEKDRVKKTYDLYCWINVTYQSNDKIITFDARTCFDEFSSEEILDGDQVNVDAADANGKKDHNCEFMRILQFNNQVSQIEGNDDWPLLAENSEHNFYAKQIKFQHKMTPMVILAVERATNATNRDKAAMIQTSINRIKDRMDKLDKKIQKIDADISSPLISAQKKKDLEDERETIEMEKARLDASKTKLENRIAGDVISSRGMWYHNNVKKSLNGKMHDIILSDLNPISNFISPIKLSTDKFNFNPLQDKEIDHAINFDSYNGHICITLPWLWINIGFLYMLIRKVKYEWKKPMNLRKMMRNFKDEDPQGKWRGGAGFEVEVQMFPKASKTLFARLCREMSKEEQTVKIDPAFETFLFETCGWQDCNEPQSPAMFFRLLGVSNVKTGCLISSNMLKTPNPRFEGIKKTFPLNAQVEIDYAVEALAATIYHTPP